MKYVDTALDARNKQQQQQGVATPPVPSSAKRNKNNSTTEKVTARATATQPTKLKAIFATAELDKCKAHDVTPREPDSTTFGDVICGRAGGGFRMRGPEPNARFQRLLQYFLDIYNACSIAGVEKRTVCIMILEFVFEQGGRLIHRNEASQRWETLSFAKCYSKVSQTFRDLRCKNSSSNEPRIKHRAGELTRQEYSAWEDLRAKIRERLGLPPEDASIIATRGLQVTKAPAPPKTQSSASGNDPSKQKKRSRTLQLERRKRPFQATRQGPPRVAPIKAKPASKAAKVTAHRGRQDKHISLRTFHDRPPTLTCTSSEVAIPDTSWAPPQSPSDIAVAPRTMVPRHVSMELGSKDIDEVSPTLSSGTPSKLACSQWNQFAGAFPPDKDVSINIAEAVYKQEDMPFISSCDTPHTSNRSNYDENISPTLARILGFSPVFAISAPITAQSLEIPSYESHDDPLLLLVDPHGVDRDDNNVDAAGLRYPGNISISEPGSTFFHDLTPPHQYEFGDRMDNVEGKSEIRFPRLRDIFDVQAISDDETSYTQRLQDMLFLSSESTGEIMETTLSPHSDFSIDADMDDSVAWSHESFIQDEKTTHSVRYDIAIDRPMTV